MFRKIVPIERENAIEMYLWRRLCYIFQIYLNVFKNSVTLNKTFFKNLFA